MTETISAPLYLLRGLQLIGWRNMQHALDYLYADGTIRQGTLVAINAEKMLAVEDNNGFYIQSAICICTGF